MHNSMRYQLRQTLHKTNNDVNNFHDDSDVIDFPQTDSDVIFTDLDHDGDGRINFEDFSFGFRDFLVPGSRRGSIQLGLLPTIPQVRAYSLGYYPPYHR